MNLGRFYPGKNSKNYGNAVTIVDTWNDLTNLEPASEGSEAFVNQGVSGTNVYGRVYVRRGQLYWDIPGANTDTISFIQSNKIPIPIIPPFTISGTRRILGRSSSYNGNQFEEGNTNTSAWVWYGIASVQGPTNISFSHRIVNQTGKDISKIAIPFFNIINNPTKQANILACWIGRGGSGVTPDTYQQVTFNDGSTSAVFTSGDQYLPSGFVSDLITLNTDWVPNEEILIKVVFDKNGPIPKYDSFGSLYNLDSGLSTGSWIGIGDAGSTSALLNENITWYGNWDMPYCHVFVEFANTEDPELSILAYGDSVINQFRYFLEPQAIVRDNWQWYLETSADSENKKYHVATAGNGSYSLSQYCDKLSATWNVYKDWFDVLMIEGWTSNVYPQTSARRVEDQNDLNAIRTKAISDNKDWLIIFPAPCGVVVSGDGDGLGQHNAMVAWANSTYSGRVVDGRPAVWDPNDNTIFLQPTYSLDNTHHSKLGGEVFAAYIKPILETTLTTLGYNI